MPVVEPLFGIFEHDRDALRRGDEAWLDEAWTRARVLVVNDRHEVPIEEGSDGPVLQWRTPESVADGQRRIFLGVLGDVPLFSVQGRRDIKADYWSGLRDIGADLNAGDRGLAVEAVALWQWHDRHVHCSVCGVPTEFRQAGWSTQCPSCGAQHFPRTDPAVIMLVHDGGDRCVLGRQPTWPEGRFSILAGFVEPGESLEAAVAREVSEEVGLATSDIQYVGSQPWPFPASIMLGFTARAEGDRELVLADGEIAEARWFTRDEVKGLFGWGDREASAPGARSMPGAISIAHHIIKAWADGQLT